MNNINLDTTNFSEQLGLYDFFDVIVTGSVFVFGLSALSNKIMDLLWSDITIMGGLGIVLLIYISGCVLQEMGSVLDHHLFFIKHFTHCTFLFDLKKVRISKKILYWSSGFFKGAASERDKNRTDKNQTSGGKKEKTGWNWVITNQMLLNHYRNLAKQIYEEYFPDEIFLDENFNDEKFNSFIFSIIQYRVACLGKDKKVEKMRALYSLSRNLMVCCCFFIIFMLMSNLVPGLKQWLGSKSGSYAITFSVFSMVLIFVFFFRMKKCKKYMARIMLGNYDASLQISKEKPADCKNDCI